MRKLIALFVFFTVTALLQAAGPNYHLVKESPIGGEGGWDYLVVDPATTCS